MLIPLRFVLVIAMLACQLTYADDTNLASELSLVIRGGLLWDGTGSVPESATISISGDRIAEVAREVIVPDGVRVIDATDLTVLPGMIDLHVHFGAPAGQDLQKTQDALMKEYIAQRPDVRRAFLESGITTIRSVGDVPGNQWWGVIGLQRAIEAQRMEGPRVFATGPIFTAPGGHPAGTIYKDNQFLIENVVRQVADADKARLEVRHLAASGVRGVKAVYDSGVRGDLPRLALPVLKAIIDEAHKHGLWVAVHTSTNQEVREAVGAGADTIEHGITDETHVEEQTLHILKKYKPTYIPTIVVTESFVPKQQRETAMRGALAIVKDVMEAGVPIGAGSDTQGQNMAFGASLHRELRLLVDAGLTPPQALHAATRNAAVAMGLEKELGTVEAGKLADMILVEGNPLDDIDAIGHVRLVIQSGRVVYDGRREDQGGRP